MSQSTIGSKQQPVTTVLLAHCFFVIWVVLVFLYLQVDLYSTILNKLLEHGVVELRHHHHFDLTSYTTEVEHRSFRHFDLTDSVNHQKAITITSLNNIFLPYFLALLQDSDYVETF
jgi:hypothetical protein